MTEELAVKLLEIEKCFKHFSRRANGEKLHMKLIELDLLRALIGGRNVQSLFENKEATTIRGKNSWFVVFTEKDEEDYD